MQGIIFNAMEEFVLEISDMAMWNDVLNSCDLKTNGVYTAGISYNDSEIISLATVLCEKLQVPVEEGMKLFGQFLFGFLVQRGPVELAEYKNTQALLIELEDVVHRDVQRIHPDAYTPFFKYIPKSEDEGELIYSSKRKLCVIAEGLLAGAAKHYGQSITMTHTQCMHNDMQDCRWNVKFSDL